METIEVMVGRVVTGNSGQTNDTRRVVRFEGEKLGKYRLYDPGVNGGITETRGLTQTLYRAADGRLVVHVLKWTRWQGEPTTYTLLVATEADLSLDGAFEDLGYECGFGRPLTLDEALRR